MTADPVKFSDDTTNEGLVTKADESAYREEVEQVVDWCTNNDLELNVAITCGFVQIPGHYQYHRQHFKMGHQCHS